MKFVHELIAAVKKGTFDLDCLEIRLVQGNGADAKVFKGPGYIRQTLEDTLVFKVYAGERRMPEAGPISFRAGTEGMLIPDSEYHALTATDQKLRVWTADRILPDQSTSHLSPTTAADVFSGSLLKLRYAHEWGEPFPQSGIAMHFQDKVQLPWSCTTKTQTTVDGEVKRGGSALNATKFRAAGFDFLLENTETGLVVEASGAQPIPLHFEVRIIEALQFVLARTVWPRAVQVYNGRLETVTLTAGVPAKGPSLLKPPITTSLFGPSDDLFRLFDKYLTYIGQRVRESWHPCTRHLYTICRDGTSSIGALALALGVGVEGVAKVLFRDLGKPGDDSKAAVADLLAHVKNWPNLAGNKDQARIRDRLPGLIGLLLSHGPKDRMLALAQRGAIKMEHIQAWSDLRNSAAHGADEPGDRPSQELIDRCHTVMVLLYCLIFHAIGYSGKFTDYSALGWPLADYLPGGTDPGGVTASQAG